MKIQMRRPAKTPNRGTPRSAGIDVYVPVDFVGITLDHGEDVLISTGIRVEIPEGHMFVAMNKSGVATKMGLIVGAEVVDEDYEGIVHVHLIKATKGKCTITPGMKIAQFVLVPVSYDNVEVVEQLESRNTERGAGGFGSTGI